MKKYNPKTPGKLGRHNTKTKAHIHRSRKDYIRSREKEKINKIIKGVVSIDR
ncbi:MAG: hypothetical protein ACOCP8_06360 [archaeon]